MQYLLILACSTYCHGKTRPCSVVMAITPAAILALGCHGHRSAGSQTLKHLFSHATTPIGLCWLLLRLCTTV